MFLCMQGHPNRGRPSRLFWLGKLCLWLCKCMDVESYRRYDAWTCVFVVNQSAISLFSTKRAHSNAIILRQALEYVDTQRLIVLVAEFEGQVARCVHDQNGNHVIQKCIEVS
jgi:hypothetical protein